MPLRSTGIGAAESNRVKLVREFFREENGQTATEYMLVISVIVVAVVAAGYLFVPEFQKGVAQLGQDVSVILDTGCLKASSINTACR